MEKDCFFFFCSFLNSNFLYLKIYGLFDGGRGFEQCDLVCELVVKQGGKENGGDRTSCERIGKVYHRLERMVSHMLTPSYFFLPYRVR